MGMERKLCYSAQDLHDRHAIEEVCYFKVCVGTY
jgi:hypothetical protein